MLLACLNSMQRPLGPRRLLLAATLWLAAGCAFAETRLALVIGNSGYETVGRLVNAGHDADLVAGSLAATGFDVIKAIDLTEEAMGDAIDGFVLRAQGADVAVVYYAGHGIQKDGENYLLPVDAKLKSASAITREGFALSEITRPLQSVPISLIFLDACRNNPVAETLLAQSPAQSRAAGVQRGLAVVQTSGDMLVAFATLPNTTASDGDSGNSPFATALARNIAAPGVEVSLMMKRVTADVMAATAGVQRPQQLSQMQREFYFVPGDQPTPPPAATERGILSVYPPQIGVGEEILVVADLGDGCTPAFVNISPSGRVTPVPLEFFKHTASAQGRSRFEIAPGSEYALLVQAQDEKGANRFGYFCEPAGMDISAKKAFLRGLLARLETAPEEGVMEQVAYQFRPYEIR